MIRAQALERWRHRAIATAAAGVLALALTGCGGDADTPAVATAGNSGAKPTTSAAAGGSVAEYVEAQRKYVKCLREQGLEVADPDAQGRIDLSSALQGRPKTDPKIVGAQAACRKHQLPVPAELEAGDPVTAEQLAHRRNYAKCMRANGMPRWPDPNPDGSWPEGGLGGELTAQEQAANTRALQICDPVMEGRPPTTPNPNATGVG